MYQTWNLKIRVRSRHFCGVRGMFCAIRGSIVLIFQAFFYWIWLHLSFCCRRNLKWRSILQSSPLLLVPVKYVNIPMMTAGVCSLCCLFPIFSWFLWTMNKGISWKCMSVRLSYSRGINLSAINLETYNCRYKANITNKRSQSALIGTLKGLSTSTFTTYKLFTALTKHKLWKTIGGELAIWQ